MDRIHIKDIALRCVIGVSDVERREKQDVVINITLYADLSKAAASDNMTDTVDYKAVKQRLVALVEGSHYYLVEALAGAIAHLCLEFHGIEQVDVLVEKPGAVRYARTVGVEITRRKTS